MDSSPRRSDPDWATAPLLPDAEDPPPSRAWYARLLDGAGVDDAAADDDDVSLESLLGNNDREDFVRESEMLMRLCYWVATNVVVYGAQRVACNPVWKSNLQPDFNVRVIDGFHARLSAVLRELDESNRFVQKSAESTSI